MPIKQFAHAYISIKHFALEFTRPKIEGGPQRRFAMPFRPGFYSSQTSKKRRNGMAKCLRGPPLDFGSNAICFMTRFQKVRTYVCVYICLRAISSLRPCKPRLHVPQNFSVLNIPNRTEEWSRTTESHNSLAPPPQHTHTHTHTQVHASAPTIHSTKGHGMERARREKKNQTLPTVLRFRANRTSGGTCRRSLNRCAL